LPQDNSTLYFYFADILYHIMATRRISRTATSLLTKGRSVKSTTPRCHPSASRYVHQSTRLPAMTASNSRSRPTLQPLHQPSTILKPAASVGGSRTIFIQTENTPNPDALKFLPNHPILPPGLSSPFLEYLNPRSTLAPPHPSPLAASLMNIDGIASVFYGADFITVTKAADAQWAHVKPEVFSLITEAVTSGAPIVNIMENRTGEDGQAGMEEDSLSYNENDSEVVGMIKELLETRIRPAIQEDGGDIEFRGFEEGNVMLKLRGACRTCDSSTVTLKNGIEGMLMHYVRPPAPESMARVCC
jgi:Fe-S cluster biogenesis protein NfuA